MEYRGIPCCAPCGGHHVACEVASDAAYRLQRENGGFPVATANTAAMIKDGVQAFRVPGGGLIVTREWLSNNAHLVKCMR